MTIFEPIFLLLALATLVSLATAGVAALRGDRPRAGRLLLRIGVGVVAYFAVVIVTSAAQARREYRVGDEQCSDDWCITVTGATRSPAPDDTILNVQLRLSNHAMQRPMGERGTSFFAMDSEGRRIDPVHRPGDVPFDSIIPAGGSLETSRMFTLPGGAKLSGLVYAHDRGFPIGWFIISEGGWFAKPPIVRLR